MVRTHSNLGTLVATGLLTLIISCGSDSESSRKPVGGTVPTTNTTSKVNSETNSETEVDNQGDTTVPLDSSKCPSGMVAVNSLEIKNDLGFSPTCSQMSVVGTNGLTFNLISLQEKPGNRSLSVRWSPKSPSDKFPVAGTTYSESPNSLDYVYQLAYFDDDHPIIDASFAKNVNLVYKKVPVKTGDAYEIDFSFTMQFKSGGDLTFSGLVSGVAQ